MDLRKLPPPPPCPLQPSPARLSSVRPRGRWGFGGQDVRAKPGGRWEGELKAQRPLTATGKGFTGAAGAVLSAVILPQLPGMEGYRWAGCAPSTFAPSKGLGARGNVQGGNVLGVTWHCPTLLAPQLSWTKLCAAPRPRACCPGARAEHGGPDRCHPPWGPFFPHAWGGCARTTSLLQALAVTAGTHPTSCPLLLGAGRAHPKQVVLPWGFPQQGCPHVPSVTQGAAMLGGAVANRHGHSGARHGTAQPSMVQHGFVRHGMAQHGLAQLCPVWLSPVWPTWLSTARLGLA